MREKFWLPGGRQSIKKVIASCRICWRLRGKAASQPFAPLPRDRIQASRPFETVGVDFAGPLYTQSDDTQSKVYIMIFTCAVVRAVHLELVLNLTTECCLLAMRRFISRRGPPKTIYSDNAKTFKKAATDIKLLAEVFNSEIFHGFLSNRGVNWKFSVERAPWWGGFWERLVKSVKDILKVTIWKAKITNEELYTLLTEAERIINSRPLTYISDDPIDLAPLTPESFLITCSEVIDNESTGQAIASDLRSKWKSRLQYTSFLWKRWKAEYLKLLRSAHHSTQTFSKEIQLGDVVLVYDASTPRIHWKLAIVETCYPGRDNKIRACEVRFADGRRFRRAVQLLYPLEIRQLARSEDVEN
ncbi:uncharacterized protein LOC129915115 [Episyrphus balteatus]|uniref:uncharacterized protein LOC129915115 n=1 Tax=Episyrphus balteatus TaxID=286459 RepID=UPI0024855CE2|nr:uncharacterized protein LOC129915115 [Episyrphus balteatus]